MRVTRSRGGSPLRAVGVGGPRDARDAMHPMNATRARNVCARISICLKGPARAEDGRVRGVRRPRLRRLQRLPGRAAPAFLASPFSSSHRLSGFAVSGAGVGCRRLAGGAWRVPG